jgi:hypothetical protein
MDRGVQSLLDEADALLLGDAGAEDDADSQEGQEGEGGGFNESLSKIDHYSDLELSGPYPHTCFHTHTHTHIHTHT